MEEAMKIRLAIADDHPLVIEGLQHILAQNRDISLVAHYSNGRDLVKGLLNTPIDVLVLDIHMPGTESDELSEMICEQFPHIKILVLTNEDNVYHIKNMLRKGAIGYLLKTTTADVLIDAIYKVHQSKQVLEPTLKERMLQDTLQAKKQLSAQPVLSDREKEVLQYIALDLTSQEIADKLFVSKRTVDYYRLCLLMKLGVKNVGGLVKKGIQLGYID